MVEDDESSIIEFLEQQTKCIITIDDKWILQWATLTEKYFKLETRNHIRLKVIALLSQIFSKYHVICEDDLMNKILLPNITDVDQETDSVVRKPIVHLLFDLATTCLSYKHCNTVLAIIRKILNKPFRQQAADDANGLFHVIGNVDIIDSRLIISNLNKLFKTKLYRLPIDPAVNMLDISVNYLNLTYKFPLQDPLPAEIPMIRRELFSLFLSLRCNKHGHLGVQASPMGIGPNLMNENEDHTSYSPFIICVKRPQQGVQATTPPTDTDMLQQQPPLPPPPVLAPVSPGPDGSATNQNNSSIHQNHPYYIGLHYQSIFVTNASHPNCPLVSRCVNLDLMFGGIIECLTQETDYDVLRYVLENLPYLLANRPLVQTASNERINQLCLALSDLTRSPGKTYQRQHQITNPSFVADTNKLGLRCLTSMLLYRKQLDQRSIKQMLLAFEDSIRVSRNQVVPQLITCLIELQDSAEMTRFLPVVLNRLSKFSPTLSMGVSMLEFLSYMIMFPRLYENFSDDEYKFIFAIALPYTNPFRFPGYITCLAFRTIAMWYLNCRPSLRCSFVDFVKKSLQSNVIQPFKDNVTPSYSLTSSPMTSATNMTQHNHQTVPITYSCPPTMSPIDYRRRSSSFNTDASCLRGVAAPNTTPNSNAAILTGPMSSAGSVACPIGLTSNVYTSQATVTTSASSMAASISSAFQFGGSSSNNTNNSCNTNMNGSNQPQQYHHQYHQHQHHQNHLMQNVVNPQSSLQVNEELIETFADLLSRYTHGHGLAITPKDKLLGFLVDRSTSQTWLLGNSLITITSCSSGRGWAEILIRRPTGNTCWIGRLQNTQSALPILNQQVYLDSLNFSNDVISLFKTINLCDEQMQQQHQQSSATETTNENHHHLNNATTTTQSNNHNHNHNHNQMNLNNPSMSTTPTNVHISGGSQSLTSSSTVLSTNANLQNNTNIMNNGAASTNTNSNSSTASNLNCSTSGSSSAASAPFTPAYNSWYRDPILLPKEKKFDIALSNFDHITPCETHKIGVVYVANSQQVDVRAQILANTCGSARYYEFLQHIGTCIVLSDIDPETYFVGGLDTKGDDGKFSYFWKDNVTQVIFHVATFMPTRESDLQCANKNRHIGNDHVCIVYNDSGKQFQLATIKGTGQFIKACIVVSPVDSHMNSIEIQVLPELREILKDANHMFETRLLSNAGTSLYARQMAMLLNLACKIYEHRRSDSALNKEPYVSNWVERLRCIKRIRKRLEENRKLAPQNNSMSRSSNAIK